MSLRTSAAERRFSKDERQALSEQANSENATEVDILRSALAESQERYIELSKEIKSVLDIYGHRIEAIERCVEASNYEKTQNITQTILKVSDEALEPLTGSVNEAHKQIDGLISELKARRQEVYKGQTTGEWLKELLAEMVVYFVTFYVALNCWNWYYGITDTLQVLNNAMYQLLQK